MTLTNGVGAETSTPAKREPKLKLSEDDFLRIVRSERQNSVGIEPGDGILEEREKALEYFKGQMDDVPTLPNRSRVVSSDVADAVYTVLPDLIEVFLGGEEIGTFRPRGEEDVEAAKQETEAVNYVITCDNDGFSIVHDSIHDALLTKVGVLYAWAEEETKQNEERLERVGERDLMALDVQGFALEDVAEVGVDDLSGETMYSATLRREYSEKCVKVCPVASEDFAVARDTKALRDTTYCVMRTRPRAQDLKRRGFDADLVDDLPGYSWGNSEQLDQARDLAGEHAVGNIGGDATHDLRSVVVYTHVIRVDADGDGAPELWRVDTDESEGVVLQLERLNAVPFSVGTPYRMPHRLYGRSLADLLLEVQRIKTMLQRSALDSANFALNQRHEVAEDGQTQDTVSDLLNNLPGAPVRVRRSGTVTPIAAGSMGYDPFEALEYFSTVAEQRTGIVRNAQGLNPDTLHETKGGLLALMTVAQRRTRMIARVLAETLFKDIFVIVHGLLREHGSREMTVRLRNKWVQIDPTSWGVRKDMSIEIGMGGGREYDLMLLESVKADMSALIEAQGGIDGPVVTAKNAYALATKRAERAGIKGVSEFYTDPETQPPKEPQQDPALAKAQLEMQARQQELQMNMQAKQAEMAMKERHTQQQFQKDVALSETQQRDDLVRARLDGEQKVREHELAVQAANDKALEAERKAEIDMERLRLEGEKLAIEREKMALERELKERELQVREREMEQAANIEAAKLAAADAGRAADMEGRRLDHAERAMMQTTPAPAAPDRSGEALGAGLAAVGEGLKALAKPKRVKRGKDGRVEGIE
jgi:hypothetical protein